MGSHDKVSSRPAPIAHPLATHGADQATPVRTNKAGAAKPTEPPKEPDPNAAKALHKGENPPQSAPAKSEGQTKKAGDSARATIDGTKIDGGSHVQLAKVLTQIMQDPAMAKTVSNALAKKADFKWASLAHAATDEQLKSLSWLFKLTPKDQRADVAKELATQHTPGADMAAAALFASAPPEEQPAIAKMMIGHGMDWDAVSHGLAELHITDANSSNLEHMDGAVSDARSAYLSALADRSPQIKALFKEFDDHPDHFPKDIKRADLEQAVLGENPPNVTAFFANPDKTKVDPTDANHFNDPKVARTAAFIVDAELHAAKLFREEAVAQKGRASTPEQQQALDGQIARYDNEIKWDTSGLAVFAGRAHPAAHKKAEAAHKPVVPVNTPANPFGALADKGAAVDLNDGGVQLTLTKDDMKSLASWNRDTAIQLLATLATKRTGQPVSTAQAANLFLQAQQQQEGLPAAASADPANLAPPTPMTGPLATWPVMDPSQWPAPTGDAAVFAKAAQREQTFWLQTYIHGAYTFAPAEIANYVHMSKAEVIASIEKKCFCDTDKATKYYGELLTAAGAALNANLKYIEI